MQTGEVVDIFITFVASSPLHSVPEVRAVPGWGLEGDRYFAATGTFVKPGKPRHPGQEVTLIESEAIEALQRETTICLDAAAARRNILTRGIALNHLVGREFNVGDVRVKGIKLCEPCNHLESLTQKGVKDGLVHRGGLRAQILTEGFIRVGDQISVAPENAAVPVAT